MKNTHLVLALLLGFLFSTNAFSQKHSSCPNVLDESIQLYQPALANVSCEYDAFGKCINSFKKIPLLDKELNFFDTRFRTTGVELLWQSKFANTSETFKILRSRDGKQFQEIGEVNSSDFVDGQISFYDNLPGLGNNHYIIKKSRGSQTLLSSPQAVYVSIGMCHLETMNIKNQKDDINFNYFVDNAGIFQLLVTDSEGHEKDRRNVSMKMGINDVNIRLPQNGIYFVTLTNGFSSITDLVVQSHGSKEGKSAVAGTGKE